MVNRKRGKNTKYFVLLLLVIGFIFVSQAGFIGSQDTIEGGDCSSGRFSCSSGGITTCCDFDTETCCDSGDIPVCCDTHTETCCSGTCVDTDTNDNNCGSCGNSCTGCKACSGGSCVDDNSQCSGECNVCSDGLCTDDDSKCASGEVCDNGNCVTCDSDGDDYNRSACGGNDCNDNNASINPDATEVCNGVDDNCDGDVDEGTGGCTEAPVCQGNVNCYQYSGSNCPTDSGCEVHTVECTVCQSGYVDPDSGACQFYPADTYGDENCITRGATDTEDCQAMIDQCDANHQCGCYGRSVPYEENKCGGFGDSCTDSQCDSDEPGCDWDYPSGDCGGYSDKNSCESDNCNWYCHESVDCWHDKDGDGDGGASSGTHWTVGGNCPDGNVTNSNDCDDSVSCLNSSGTTWYKDADDDNYYADINEQCSPASDEWHLNQSVCDPDGYNSKTFSGPGDCNDNNASIKPGVTDVCNGVNDDCDDQTDEDASCDSGETCSGGSCTSCDGDGDGFDSEAICGGNDCNDNNGSINPDASEICNGVDDDCDGDVDSADSDLKCCPSTESTDCPDSGTCGADNTCVTPDAFWSNEDPTSDEGSQKTDSESASDENELPYPPSGMIYMVYEYSGLSEGESVEFQVREDDGNGITGGDDNIRTVTGTVDSDRTAYAEFNFTKEDLEDKASDWPGGENYPDDQESETWEFYFQIDAAGYDGNDKDEDFLNFTLDRSDTCEIMQISSCSDYNSLPSGKAETACNSNQCGVTSSGQCGDSCDEHVSCSWNSDTEKCETECQILPDNPCPLPNCDTNDQCWLDYNCDNTTCTCEDGYEETDLGYCKESGTPLTLGTCFYEESTTDDCSDGLLNYSWDANWTWDKDNEGSGCTSVSECPNEEDYVCDEGYCRFDPQAKNEDCSPGSDIRACPAEIKVPFFNAYNVIATVLIIGIIYYFWMFRGNRKLFLK